MHQLLAFGLLLIVGLDASAPPVPQCKKAELTALATCLKTTAPNLSDQNAVAYFQANLTACFQQNGCPAPDWSQNGYQDIPDGFQTYITAMKDWYNGLSDSQQQCISDQMLTQWQKTNNVGKCVAVDMRPVLSAQHTSIFNKGTSNKDQAQGIAVAASNARIAAKQCGITTQMDQCIRNYKHLYYNAQVCDIRNQCLSQTSRACYLRLKQEFPAMCRCAAKEKSSVSKNVDVNSTQAIQQYYNERKTELNNAAQTCGIQSSTLPQITDHFQQQCPNFLGNALQSSGKILGLFNGDSFLGQQVNQAAAVPEYGCIGVIATANKGKFDEMNQRIQSGVEDEPMLCTCAYPPAPPQG